MTRDDRPYDLGAAKRKSDAISEAINRKFDLVIEKLNKLYVVAKASRRAEGRMNARHIAIYRERGLDMAPLLRKPPVLP